MEQVRAGAVDPAFLPRAELTAPRLAELAALDDAAFRALFAGTAVKRTGRDRFVRNVLIAIGNAPSATPELIAAAASSPRRCLAAGARRRRMGARPHRPATCRRRSAAPPDHETDPAVKAEWETLFPMPPAGV